MGKVRRRGDGGGKHAKAGLSQIDTSVADPLVVGCQMLLGRLSDLRSLRFHLSTEGESNC